MRVKELITQLEKVAGVEGDLPVVCLNEHDRRVHLEGILVYGDNSKGQRHIILGEAL